MKHQDFFVLYIYQRLNIKYICEFCFILTFSAVTNFVVKHIMFRNEKYDLV